MVGMRETSYNTEHRDPVRPGWPSEEYGELQRLVDALYARNPSQAVSRMDVIVRAEVDDLCDDLQEVVRLLPGGSYKRRRLCDQLNSIVTAHGWAYLYGTVE
jgi:hypothetical protein